MATGFAFPAQVVSFISPQSLVVSQHFSLSLHRLIAVITALHHCAPRHTVQVLLVNSGSDAQIVSGTSVCDDV